MDGSSRYLERIWHDVKTWRTFKLGPFAFHFRLGRAHKRLSRSIAFSNEVFPGAPAPTRKTAPGVAVVVGMGTEIGPTIARRLAAERMQVATISRSPVALEGCDTVRAYQCDVTDQRACRRTFGEIRCDLGVPSLVVYGVQGWSPGKFIDIEVAAFEEAWRANCLGAFIVAQQAARVMRENGGGTIVLLGATSGTVGRPGYLNLAVGKFGMRAIAQVMARELSAEGVHVAHLVIDADVRTKSEGRPHTHPEDLAEVVWSLHCQPRSTWTHELDVRPYNEQFWEHC